VTPLTPPGLARFDADDRSAAEVLRAVCAARSRTDALLAADDAVSAREQDGVREAQRRELPEPDRAYRERHGRVLPICATGRGGEETLAVLKERIGNGPATEREAVRGEPGRIDRVRLTRPAEGGR
jgi:2-oxo-4-hydroxy-4-carboxy--5-ureidoimidazoline (OHCU) decarboxylase